MRGTPFVALWRSNRLRVLDLFSGTGSSTYAFVVRAHSVMHVELDPQHKADLYADVTQLTPKTVIAWLGGRPDFIWASPPCQAFSVASIGKYWERGGKDPRPKHPKAEQAQAVVQATLRLIHALAPTYWLLENPRGMLRTLPLMRPYDRRSVTYCQYGDDRQKPTDLWGVMPLAWNPRPMCQPRAGCHQSAPRGSRTGTQGRDNAVERSRVPFELSMEICRAVENVLDESRL
jgi:hypothetical protein